MTSNPVSRELVSMDIAHSNTQGTMCILVSISRSFHFDMCSAVKCNEGRFGCVMGQQREARSDNRGGGENYPTQENL
jgi:hypothetical protein